MLPVAPTGWPAGVREEEEEVEEVEGEGEEEEEERRGAGEHGATFEMYFETYPAVFDESVAANATGSAAIAATATATAAAAAAAAAAPTVLLLNPTGGCTDGNQTSQSFPRSSHAHSLTRALAHSLIHSSITSGGTIL